MPTYIWFGIDCNGKKISGNDYANNRDQLKNKLEKRHIFLLKTQTTIGFLGKNSKIRAKHIANFIEQLAFLINAHIPLLTA